MYAASIFNFDSMLSILLLGSSVGKRTEAYIYLFSKIKNFFLIKFRCQEFYMHLLVHNYSRNERHLWGKEYHLFITRVELNFYIFEGRAATRVRNGREIPLSIKFKR